MTVGGKYKGGKKKFWENQLVLESFQMLKQKEEIFINATEMLRECDVDEVYWWKRAQRK